MDSDTPTNYIVIDWTSDPLDVFIKRYEKVKEVEDELVQSIQVVIDAASKLPVEVKELEL
jgi:hypothetical protein